MHPRGNRAWAGEVDDLRSAAVIKHYGQMQLMEERVYFGVCFQRDESVMAEKQTASNRHWAARAKSSHFNCKLKAEEANQKRQGTF